MSREQTDTEIRQIPKLSNNIEQKNYKPTILLVEDSPLIQRIHQRFLERMNCKVVIAENGSRALELFENKPDLVLLDVGLPGLNGIEACRLMRSLEYSQRIPIIGLTAYSNIIEFECRSAGMDDFFVKPISTNDFYVLLYRWLPQFRSILSVYSKSHRLKL